MPRSYRQFCGLACALDLVGERWTLLIVRDLWLGPRRYSDLAESLQGIGAGLLASRLRHLEEQGLVQRVFRPAPVNAVVYELTDDGEALAEAMMPLAAWGVEHLDTLAGGDARQRSESLALALKSRYDPVESIGVHDTYELRVDDDVFTIRADDGTVTVEQGPADDPDAVVTMDVRTMMEIGMGKLPLDEAIARARMVSTGDRDALLRWTRMLRLPGRRRVSAPLTSGRVGAGG